MGWSLLVTNPKLSPFIFFVYLNGLYALLSSFELGTDQLPKSYSLALLKGNVSEISSCTGGGLDINFGNVFDVTVRNMFR